MTDKMCVKTLPKTSSEIISEAKAALNIPPCYIKPLTTKRPFTPRERVFFGHRRTNRPPSVIKSQHVQFQEKKSPIYTKLPALDNSKCLYHFENTNEVNRQSRSSLPNTTRRRSNPDLVFNENVSGKKLSSLSFPLSIDALLKHHCEPNYYDHDYMNHENEINEARALCFDAHVDCLCVVSLIENKMMKTCLGEVSEMCALLDKLATAVKRESISIARDDHKKASILSTVFRLANSSTNDELIIHILLVLLRMQISGKYLATVCKLFFKVARSDKNDRLFLETNALDLFVDMLGLATPNEDAEALIYGYGALKFLTMNPDLMERAMSNGCLPLMLLHLKMINLERAERPKLPESVNHVLFQLTGALRNVVNDDKFYSDLLASGGLATIYRTLELFSGDVDVVTNISRIISILSTDGKCCEALVEFWTNVSVLLSLLDKYPGQGEVVVRITYALGNILTYNENARHQLYDACCSMGTFLNLLQLYLEKDLINLSRNTEFSVIEDVLIKVIRVVVNMSIQPEIGAKLVMAANDRHPIHMVKECEQFLDALLTILRRKSVDENEELVHAALAALNNLSYFGDMTVASRGPFACRQLDITQTLSLMLNTRNHLCKVEVVRVFGNMTRSSIVRNYLLETGGLLTITNCLESGDRQLIMVCCGVLVNMTSDEDSREAFKGYGGISKIVNILKTPDKRDWTLYLLICQTLWNVCSGSDGFPDDPMVVLDTLVRLTDEEQLFTALLSSDEEKATEYKQWEDFASVATNLLEWLDELLEGRFANVEN